MMTHQFGSVRTRDRTFAWELEAVCPARRRGSAQTVVLEIKDMLTEEDKAARRWIAAVNNWGKLGRWTFQVCRDPQVLEYHHDRAVRFCGRHQAVEQRNKVCRLEFEILFFTDERTSAPCRSSRECPVGARENSAIARNVAPQKFTLEQHRQGRQRRPRALGCVKFTAFVPRGWVGHRDCRDRTSAQKLRIRRTVQKRDTAANQPVC
jgi:hypothetical protein